jgi:hypothetical protein
MTHVQSNPADAAPECFLVTADGLVQSVLRRYRAVLQAPVEAHEPQQATDSAAVA